MQGEELSRMRQRQAEWDSWLGTVAEAAPPTEDEHVELETLIAQLGQAQRVRRGRPNRALQEFFSDRGLSHSARTAPVPPTQPASVPESGAPLSEPLPPPVPVPQVHTQKLLRRGSEGSGVRHPATLALQEAWQQCKRSKVPVDEKVAVLAEKYLESGFHLASRVVLQEQVDLDPRGAMMRLNRLACSLWLQDLHERVTLEESLVAALPEACLLFYGDFCSYDETPMVTSVKLTRTPSDRSTLAAATAPSPLPQHVACLEALRRGLPSPKLSTTSKLLQVRQHYGMLLQVTLPSRPQTPSYCYIMGETSTPLQAMSRNNSQTLVECLRRVQGNAQAANAFRFKMRGVVVDEAPSNKTAEESLAQQKPRGWQHLMLPCDTHKASRCHTKTLDAFLGSDVAGLIHLAISVREAGKMAIFRAAMSEVIQERLVILQGQPSDEAKFHREQMLSLFVSHGPNGLVRRVLLDAAANGDWRNGQRFQHYVPSTAPVLDPRPVAEHVSRCVVAALAGHQPHIYPRHRWTGGDQSVDDIAILLAVHNLLPHVYGRFQAMLDPKNQTQEHSSTQPPPQDVTATISTAATAQTVEELMVSTQGLPASSSTGPTSSGQVPEGLSADQNAQLRASAGKWLLKSPLPNLMLMRLVLMPLSKLMRDQLFLAGQDYETQERWSAVQSISDGQESFKGRTFRLVAAASGVLEGKFHRELQRLFSDSAQWSYSSSDLPNRIYEVFMFQGSEPGWCMRLPIAFLEPQHLPHETIQIASAARAQCRVCIYPILCQRLLDAGSPEVLPHVHRAGADPHLGCPGLEHAH